MRLVEFLEDRERLARLITDLESRATFAMSSTIGAQQNFSFLPLPHRTRSSKRQSSMSGYFPRA